MPTGYTAALYDGKDVSFPDFVMKCARLVGANLDPKGYRANPTVRDDERAATSAEAQIARIEAWDDVKANQQAQLAYDRAQREYRRAMAEMTARRERYEAMLFRAKTWTPPTVEHQALKVFMTRELEEAIKHDCNTDSITAPQRLTGAAYKQQRLLAARSEASYCTNRTETDMERIKRTRDWFDTLHRSLAAEEGEL